MALFADLNRSEDTLVKNSAYIFLFYLIISFNFVGPTLGCSIQKALTQNVAFKQVLLFLGLYVFTTLTGDHQNPWWALAYTVPLYLLFLLSTRATFVPVGVFLVLLFAVYLAEKHKNFYYKDPDTGDITHKHEFDTFTHVQIATFAVAIVVLLYGAYAYYAKQRRDHAKDWRWSRYIWGVRRCKSV